MDEFLIFTNNEVVEVEEVEREESGGETHTIVVSFTYVGRTYTSILSPSPPPSSSLNRQTQVVVCR